MKSQYPCVVRHKLTGEYFPKSWRYYIYARDIEWTTDLKKAKIYRNSAGAKNALHGLDFYNKTKQTEVEVVEFHKEMERRK